MDLNYNALPRIKNHLEKYFVKCNQCNIKADPNDILECYNGEKHKACRKCTIKCNVCNNMNIRDFDNGDNCNIMKCNKFCNRVLQKSQNVFTINEKKYCPAEICDKCDNKTCFKCIRQVTHKILKPGNMFSPPQIIETICENCIEKCGCNENVLAYHHSICSLCNNNYCIKCTQIIGCEGCECEDKCQKCLGQYIYKFRDPFNFPICFNCKLVKEILE
jgi:hypothetical protein